MIRWDQLIINLYNSRTNPQDHQAAWKTFEGACRLSGRDGAAAFSQLGQESDFPPIMLAIVMDQLEAAKIMLELGADIYACSFGGSSIIGHLSDVDGDGHLFEFVISNGYDLEKKDKSGATCLDYALSRNVTLLRILLRHFHERGEMDKLPSMPALRKRVRSEWQYRNTKTEPIALLYEFERLLKMKKSVKPARSPAALKL